MLNWLLPENIADVLPSEARKIEELRRSMLDHFRLYGYELVMPPMLEYLESLLPVPSPDMALRMFKLVDQLSGRTLGVRADMTIQVARIDAHLLNRNSVTRLCYAGSVLHARPSGLHANREPLQIGAEIYGHSGLEADAEIQELALGCLSLAGMEEVRLDLSHAGILRAILARDTKAQADEDLLYSLLQKKDVPGLQDATRGYEKPVQSALLALTRLYGDISVIDRARQAFLDNAGILKALEELEVLVRSAQLAGASVTIDLADLSGYQYESGIMFSIYVPGLPNAVARGGRYDHVGAAFGRARPATGFSMDLRELARLLPSAQPKKAICAPWGTEPELRALIKALREQGEVVIQCMPGQESSPEEFDCDRAIVLNNGNWILKE